MKQYDDTGFRVGMSLEDEANVRQHVLEILEEARETSGVDADGSLHLGEIYERFIYRRTKQALAAMVRDGQVIRLGCGCYALARWDPDSLDCACHAPVR